MKATKPRKPKKPRKLPGQIVGEMNGLPIRRMQVGQITGAAYNARTITDHAFRGLKNSIDTFGLVQAPVWNKKTRRLVGGHQRMKTQDPDRFIDVVEVDLTEIKEKALNVALNNPHIGGEFTAGLADLLNEIEIEIPDLAEELNLGELFVDVPSDLDDLLLEDNDGPTEGEEIKGSKTKNPEEKSGTYEKSDIKQIILVLKVDEHAETTALLEEVMKNETMDDGGAVESYSAAVMWLAREYGAE